MPSIPWTLPRQGSMSPIPHQLYSIASDAAALSINVPSSKDAAQHSVTSAFECYVPILCCNKLKMLHPGGVCSERPVADLMLAAQIWPEDQFPMKRVGKLTLNQNVANYFNEVEQLAFSPSHILPGEASCCRMYQ